MTLDGNHWLNSMQRLKSMHHSIAEFLKNKKVAYLDIPMHFNVGDLLIYLGTETFFLENKIDVIYRASLNNINYRKLTGVDVIVFHGGGNFGDIYHAHQNIREEIIGKFKNKFIICLPQTIYFSSENKKNSSVKLFREHQHIYLYARDKSSFQIGKEFTDNVYLMPDMAHSLHPLISEKEVSFNKEVNRILNLKRRDIEKQINIDALNINKREFDWPDIITTSNQRMLYFYTRFSKLGIKPEMMMKMWHKEVEGIVFKSIEYFMNCQIIYTDRLHGIILSALLGKRIHFYDNSYGKNASYIDCWLSDYPLLNG